MHTGPASAPSRITLKGDAVTLRPLQTEHAAALYRTIGGHDNHRTWTYIADGPFDSIEAFESSIASKAQSPDPLFFTAFDNRQDSAIGHAALMRIDTKSRSIEVGNIVYSPSVQRSTITTETIYLFAKHVFNDLGYRRFEWKCDNLNLPSKRAAVRFGFCFEGIFRKHIVYKNRSRDTAWFSIVDSDWPVVQKAFEAWLDESNFDANGCQKRRLEDLRESLPSSKGPVALQL